MRTARMLSLIVVILAGCKSMDSRAQPVTLPPSVGISSIEVTPNSGEQRPTKVITRQSEIATFVAFPVKCRPRGAFGSPSTMTA